MARAATRIAGPVLAAALALSLVPGPSAAAQTPVITTPPAPLALLGATPPVVRGAEPDPFAAANESARRRLAATPDVLGVVEDRVEAAKGVEAEALAALSDAEAALGHLRLVRQSQLEKLAVLGAELIDARRDQTTHSVSLVQLMQGSFTEVGDTKQILLGDPVAAARQQYNGELSESAAVHLQALLRRDAARISRLEREQVVARVLLNKIEADIESASGVVEAANQRFTASQNVRKDSELFLRKVAAERRYPGLDVDVIVLDAYLRAARTSRTADPACGLEWWALAAVGSVESNHAWGRTINANGDVVEPIIGPTLDGTGDNKRVSDTDKGALDGDTEFDHAVGPMQFTPETWKALGVDGNGDRVVNVANLYDAAAAAARKLCRDRDGKRLDFAAGYAGALFEYNNSDRYVARVMLAAREIQQSEVQPSRAITLLTGPINATSASAIAVALAKAGRPAELAARGAPWSVMSALQPGREDRPSIVAGTVVVAADSSWSSSEQLSILKALLRDGKGLRTLWLPAAPGELGELDALLRGSTITVGPLIDRPSCSGPNACDPAEAGRFATELMRQLDKQTPVR